MHIFVKLIAFMNGKSTAALEFIHVLYLFLELILYVFSGYIKKLSRDMNNSYVTV